MAQGKKYSDDVKEQAYILYATCGNYAEVARQLNVGVTAVKRWIKNKPSDEMDELRRQKKVEFIDRCTELIDKTMDRLEAELEHCEKDIPVNQLATVIGVLCDKRAMVKESDKDETDNEIKITLNWRRD